MTEIEIMVEVPIQRLSEEEQEMLRYQRELERQRIRRDFLSFIKGLST